MSVDKAITLSEVAALLDAQLVIHKDVSRGTILNTLVKGVSTLADASKEQVTFLSNARYKKHLGATKALAVIVHESLAQDCEANCLVHADPYQAYAKLTRFFDNRPLSTQGIHPAAIVSESASISSDASIGPGVVIGANVVIGKNATIAANVVIEAGVSIGDNVFLCSNVSLCHHVRLGNNVSVQPGAVIGGDGFGYAPVVNAEKGSVSWSKIAQLGTVVIGSHVEIGANTTIDRGALNDTVIEDNVIIDNQVQIAHNVFVGEGTAIAGCVGVAGSAHIGKRCSIGGGAGIAGHLTIADGTSVLGMTLINRSVNQAGVYASGTGMQEASSWRKSAVRFTQLDELNSRIKKLEKESDVKRSKG